MLQEVKKMLSERLGVSPDKVVESARLKEDLGADSLDLVDLLIEMDDNLGIKLSDDEANSIKTVADVIAAIQKNKK